MPTQSAPNNGNRDDKQQTGAPAPEPGGEQQGSPAKSPPQFDRAKRPEITYDDEDEGQPVHFLF